MSPRAPWPVLLMTRSLGHGGTERQVAEFARSFDRTWFTPHIACFDPGGFREDELREQGVPILQMNMSSFAGRDSLHAFARLRNYVRAHSIRLVHTFDHPMNVFGVPCARLLRVPVVLSSQRSHRSLIPSKYLPAIRFSDRLASGIVVNCEFVRRHLIADYHVPERKLHLCYNTLDTGRFFPGPRERPFELTNASLVIGTVCVLRHIKGLGTLIDAFARLLREQAGSRLLIVGNGPERVPLQQRAKELGVFDACLFRDSTHDVAFWLRAIDVFVLPSLSEALSNSLLEAMSSGCCAVASSAGGNPELIEHGHTGLLFPPGDAESLAAQLASVAADRQLRERLAEAGSSCVRTKFCTARSVTRMQEIYMGYLKRLG